MVQDLQIVTGGFPAEYGYALGAVIDVTTRHAVGPPSGESSKPEPFDLLLPQAAVTVRRAKKALARQEEVRIGASL